MNGCTLFPPNTQRLSDTVIGSVVQRGWVPEGPTDEEGAELARPSQLRSQFSAYTQARHGAQYEPTKALEDRPVRRSAPSTVKQVEVSASSATRLVEDYSAQPGPSIKSQRQRGLARKDSAISTEEHQRELRRMRQIRYRKKKYDVTMKLEEDTVQLREEVEQLEQRRRTIAAAVPTNQSMWDVALKYFQVFRYGVQERASIQKPTSAPGASSSPQLEFVLATMTKDVVFNSCCGSDAIMEAWKCQTLWFKDFELELESLVKGSGSSLVATTTTSFTIVDRTLQKVFPHLSEKSGFRSVGLRPRVANTLLGERVSVRGSVRFEWDGVLGRVTRVTTQSDLLTPILRLLGNLEDVAYVFERALVSPDFLWRQLM